MTRERKRRSFWYYFFATWGCLIASVVALFVFLVVAFVLWVIIAKPRFA